jgi:hypothetical protein
MDDVASWHWAIHAAKPGVYELVATVSVLDDDMESLLKPTQDFRMVLTVQPTTGYVLGKVGQSVLWVVGSLTSIVGLVALISQVRKRRDDKQKLPTSKNVSEAVNTFTPT